MHLKNERDVLQLPKGQLQVSEPKDGKIVARKLTLGPLDIVECARALLQHGGAAEDFKSQAEVVALAANRRYWGKFVLAVNSY